MNPRQSFRSPRNMRGETTSRHQQEDNNRKTPTRRGDEADEADAQTTPGLQLKKFNHSYQLHHRDTLVDVPLRSAGTFFILAPVRCSAEKEELTSSFISPKRMPRQQHTTRTPLAWSLAQIPIFLSIVIRRRARSRYTLPVPGIPLGKLKRAVDAPSPPDQSPHATNHVLHAPAWIPSGFTAALGSNKEEEEEEIRVPPSYH
jgi:hypothetical protein